MLIAGVAAVFVAGLSTLILVPFVARSAARFGAVDEPGGRKHHRQPVPRLGGVAIFTGLLLGLAVGVALAPPNAFEDLVRGGWLNFAVALLLIFLLGIADDLRGISPLWKFVVQFAAALILVAGGWSFSQLGLPWAGEVDLGMLAPVVSMLWIIGITNAINLLDGIDGLAGGIAAIIAASFLALAAFRGHPETVLLCGAMTGACLGFLHHNWAPARIFMGDSGSLSLGFLLAAISLYSSFKASAAVAILVPFLALGLPAIDTLLVMAVRFLESPDHPLLNRIGRMFQADREHLHHLALDLAPQRSRIVLALYALVAVFCVMGLAVALSPSSTVGWALLGVEILVILLIRQLGIRARARSLARSHREEIRTRLSDLEAVPPEAALQDRPVLKRAEL
jgi:UDP-GlcNAc:undecaprenyl-phosphate GlcNAc-1-phosphate transferase